MASDESKSPPPPLEPWQVQAMQYEPMITPPTPQPVHSFFNDIDAATPRSIFVPTLIFINVAVFAAMVFSGLNILMPDAQRTIGWGVDFWPFTTHGQWWRLLTSAFVHFGIFHVGLNMWALYAIGKFTERLFGNVFFLTIYLLCAVFSGITSIWFEHVAVAAGASGAIFGINGALIAYLLLQRAAFPPDAAARMLRTVSGYVVLNIMFGFSFKGISNGAHLGGLVSGFILGAVMARPLERVRRLRQTVPKFAAGLALGVAMIVAGLAFMPKVTEAEFADRRFVYTVELLAPQQIEADARFESAKQLHDAGTLSDADFAARLKTQIIPAWASISERLESIKIDDNSTVRLLYEVTLQYSQTSRDMMQALGDSLTTKDDQKTTDYHALLAKREQLGKIRQIIRQQQLQQQLQQQQSPKTDQP